MERVDSKDFLPYLDSEKISEEDFLEVCFRESLILERNGDTWSVYSPSIMGNAQAISDYIAELAENGALEDYDDSEDYSGMPADCVMRARELEDE